MKGLKIEENKQEKTEQMYNKTASNLQRKGISLDEEVEYVAKLVTPENELSKEIDQRITAGWKRHGELNSFVNDKEIPIYLKWKIMKTVLLPAMTYGAEAWSLTRSQERKLQVAQRSMERSVLGATRKGKIRNEIISSRTNVMDVMERVRVMKGQWAGHVARMNDSRWAKKVTE